MGHALNKILKDLVVKSHNMLGFDAPYIPGWDCHGLPIELKVDRELGPKKKQMSTADFRRACRDYAEKYVDIQRRDFKRLAVLGLWDDPYKTLAPTYQAAIVRERFSAVVRSCEIAPHIITQKSTSSTERSERAAPLAMWSRANSTASGNNPHCTITPSASSPANSNIRGPLHAI